MYVDWLLNICYRKDYSILNNKNNLDLGKLLQFYMEIGNYRWCSRSELVTDLLLNSHMIRSPMAHVLISPAIAY